MRVRQEHVAPVMDREGRVSHPGDGRRILDARKITPIVLEPGKDGLAILVVRIVGPFPGQHVQDRRRRIALPGIEEALFVPMRGMQCGDLVAIAELPALRSHAGHAVDGSEPHRRPIVRARHRHRRCEYGDEYPGPGEHATSAPLALGRTTHSTLRCTIRARHASPPVDSSGSTG